MYSEKMITLFDEYGTPTLNQDRENVIFAGVAVSYKKSDEKTIFSKVEDVFGFNKTQPIKNAQISVRKSIEIAESLIQLPLHISVITVDLNNPQFVESITAYYERSNKIRTSTRNIKSRPVAQIIHSKVLSNCIFEAITLCLETSSMLSEFEVFIDNWSIPQKEILIYLQYRSESLSKNVKRLFPYVDVHPIELLSCDNKRKRFIDIITSIISRNFDSISSEKYSDEPFKLLFSSQSIKTTHVDITEKETDLMNSMINEFNNNANIENN
jgi:hypothetical protein